jgi:DNA modification methylase
MRSINGEAMNEKFKDKVIGMDRKPASWFQPNPLNFRRHPQNQREAVVGSILEIGFIDPVLVNKNTGKTIDGHLRVELALEESPDFMLPVIFLDLTQEEEDLAILTLDESSGLATTDREILEDLMMRAEPENKDLLIFLDQIAKDHAIESWFQDPVDPPEYEDNYPDFDGADDLVIQWKVKTGQLWALGEHRLYCGDSTDPDVLDELMSGEKARMIFTDPPYGIGKEIQNDDLNHEDLMALYNQYTQVALPHLIENGYMYTWGYFDVLSDYYQMITKETDLTFRNFIIWAKLHGVQGINVEEFRQFPPSYEACLLMINGNPFGNNKFSTTPNAENYHEIFDPIRSYLDEQREIMDWDIKTAKRIAGHSEKSFDHWFGKSQWAMPTKEVYDSWKTEANGEAFLRSYADLKDEHTRIRKEYDEMRGYFDNTNGFTDVWIFDEMTGYEGHPTVKPVELCERGVITSSKEGEIVLDMFLGSGSTLIASHNQKRRCYAVEVDPKFVAMVLDRFHRHTDIEPILISE